MNKNGLIVGVVTFGLFFSEALLHYNLGVHKDQNEPKKFIFPSTQDLIKLGLIVGVFSVLNVIIIHQISKT